MNLLVNLTSYGDKLTMGLRITTWNGKFTPRTKTHRNLFPHSEWNKVSIVVLNTVHSRESGLRHLCLPLN